MSPSDQRIRVSPPEAEPPLFAGIDLGGTNIKSGLVDNQGRTLAYHTTPTKVEQGPEDGARRMGECVHELLRQAGVQKDRLARVGLATPGTMDIPAGMLLDPHNLPGWKDFPVRERVHAHCGFEVTFQNDANAAAYGEYWVGKGREYNSMILLTLGTGVGGGIIIGDVLISGEHSHGAEVGHIIIDYHDDAREGPPGFTGRLEPYASATGLLNRAQEALSAGDATSLRGRVEGGEELTPILIGEEAKAGDGLSMRLIMETAAYLGVGIVTLMHVIDPDVVVLGGAMTFGGESDELGRKFLGRVQEEVNRRAFPIPAERTRLAYASLGGDAGYIGAAGLARRDHNQSQT